MLSQVYLSTYMGDRRKTIKNKTYVNTTNNIKHCIAAGSKQPSSSIWSGMKQYQKPATSPASDPHKNNNHYQEIFQYSDHHQVEAAPPYHRAVDIPLPTASPLRLQQIVTPKLFDSGWSFIKNN